MRNPFASPLWQNSAFVRVWSAATISIFGSLITRMALPFVAILVLGAGAFEVALVRSIDLLAALLFGLLVGAWVDRLRRRPVMVWADLGRAVLLVTIPIAAVGGWLTLAHLLLVSFLVAILSTFFDAADNAYLPSIVPRDELVRANGALAASGSAAEFTAFGISGFLVQLLSALALFIDAVSFVVSALLLGSIRRPEPPPPPRRTASRSSTRSEGLAIIARDPIIRAFTLASMAMATLWGVFGAIWILFAIDELGLGAADRHHRRLRWPELAHRGHDRRAGHAAPGCRSRGHRVHARGDRRLRAHPPRACRHARPAFGFLVGQQLIGDGAVTLYDVAETSVRQARVHDRALGRVAATVQVGSVGAQLAAALAAGLLAEVIGLRATAFLAPLGTLVAAGILVASPVRHCGTCRCGRPLAGRGRRRRGARSAGRRVGLREEGVDERLGIERDEVTDLLTHANKADGHVQGVFDGEHDAALGGRVELGEDDPGQADRLVEGTRLSEAVLARGGIQDEQRLGLGAGQPLVDDAPDLRARPSGSTWCGGGPRYRR